jgi:hypothetical protein
MAASVNPGTFGKSDFGKCKFRKRKNGKRRIGKGLGNIGNHNKNNRKYFGRVGKSILMLFYCLIYYRYD